MYSTRSNLILGFHGCEKSEQLKLISNPSYIKSSNESLDWLGHGMYFWENNPRRGLLRAELKMKAGKLKDPSVIGAVIDLGKCLDLLDSRNIELLKHCYNLFKAKSEELDKPIPTNVNHPSSSGRDKELRYLDCAVIEYTTTIISPLRG